MNLMTRYKQWRLWRRAAKAWRKTTGGTMRFVWHIDGARVEFSTPDLHDLPGLIRVLDTYTASLREVHTMKANTQGNRSEPEG